MYRANRIEGMVGSRLLPGLTGVAFCLRSFVRSLSVYIFPQFISLQNNLKYFVCLVTNPCRGSLKGQSSADQWLIYVVLPHVVVSPNEFSYTQLCVLSAILALS